MLYDHLLAALGVLLTAPEVHEEHEGLHIPNRDIQAEPPLHHLLVVFQLPTLEPHCFEMENRGVAL